MKATHYSRSIYSFALRAAVHVQVHLGQHRVHGALVAVKIISKQKLNVNRKLTENLESEISILTTYKHPNIVELFEIKVCTLYRIHMYQHES
jgi:serine/threonine protein kinase